MIITRPERWVFSNTAVHDGQPLRGVIDGEYDRYHPGNGVPDNLEIFAHSPLPREARSRYADMTYYSAPSGAGVFDTGTQAWVSLLGPTNPVQAVIDITAVLTVFRRGPTGRFYPSKL
jgi:hypothetical protein